MIVPVLGHRDMHGHGAGGRGAPLMAQNHTASDLSSDNGMASCPSESSIFWLGARTPSQRLEMARRGLGVERLWDLTLLSICGLW